MHGKNIKVILFFLIFSLTNLSGAIKKDAVLIIPFDNKGDIEIDYISEFIQNSLFAFFNISDEYSVINLIDFKEFLKKNQYQKGDMQNKNTLFRIAKTFKARYIITGKYDEKDKILIIDFEVIDAAKMMIIYRYSKSGKGGVFTPDSVDAIASSMTQDFTGINLNYGFININTDHKCLLMIDDEIFCETPAKIKVSTGKHKLRVIYKDEDNDNTVFEKIVNLVKDEKLDINIRVFVNLKIDAEKECKIYINNKNMGVTPFEDKILSGNKYELKVTLLKENNNEELVTEKEISTQEEKDILLNIPITGTITLISGNNPFVGGIVGKEFKTLPFTFEGVEIGNCLIKAYLDDIKWKRKLIFYNRNHYIKPLENKIIDLSSIGYKKKWWLVVFPSALQFYNRQPIKGSILLSTFLTTITIAALSPLFAWSYRQIDYVPKVNIWNEKTSNSIYTKNDVTTSFQNIDYIFKGFLIGGLAASFIIYISSIIDGIVNMNHIYKIFNHEKGINNKKTMIKIKPELKIIF